MLTPTAPSPLPIAPVPPSPLPVELLIGQTIAVCARALAVAARDFHSGEAARDASNRVAAAHLTRLHQLRLATCDVIPDFAATARVYGYAVLRAYYPATVDDQIIGEITDAVLGILTRISRAMSH